ncbi:MAG: peptidylprolyl isomerase [Myxococcales bacterium]|nr:peptidylprolyl isomerase [Myxococcales bacterium]
MTPTSMYRLASLAGLAGFALACAVVGSSCKDDAPGPVTATKAINTAPAGDDEVLATVGSEVITVGELNEQLAAQSPYIRTRYTSAEQKREFLEAMVRFEILAQEAVRRGLDKDPQVVLATKKALAELLVRSKFDDVVLPETITDDEIATYYQAHLEAFITVPEVRASALVLATKAQGDAATTLAREPAQATNEAFAKLVDEMSLHAESKQRRGDLRYFTQANTDLPAAVVAAAFALPAVGSISDPIKTGDAEYWILRLTDRRPARQKELTEVKQEVRYRVYDEKRLAARQELVEGLRAGAKIEIDQAALGKVVLSPPSTATPVTGKLPATPPLATP